MGQKAVERRYAVNKTIEECRSLVKTALNELNLKKLKIKKEVAPKYLLAEYSSAWLERKEIEFTFEERQNASEIAVKWFYPFTENHELAVAPYMCMVDDIKASENERKHRIENLLEDLKSRIGATEVSTHPPSARKKD